MALRSGRIIREPLPLMKSTAKDWDDVRAGFASSIMVDTPLNSLAQNLDGVEWPIKAKEETPARYIDLTFEEALEVLQLRGQPADRIDQLIEILRETLAFDNPFGEMVAQTEVAAERDNVLLKNLTKLGIPENFPIVLTALEPGTIEFCKLEKLATLGEFAVFAQGMSQNVIVGGDFRKLLNALSHVDEESLAAVLPFRPGTKGLHLIEALAKIAPAPDAAARVEVAVSWFQEELKAIERDLSAGGALERHFVVLGNPTLEAKAVQLLRPHLRISKPAAEPEKKKSGMFGWLFRK